MVMGQHEDSEATRPLPDAVGSDVPHAASPRTRSVLRYSEPPRVVSVTDAARPTQPQWKAMPRGGRNSHDGASQPAVSAGSGERGKGGST